MNAVWPNIDALDRQALMAIADQMIGCINWIGVRIQKHDDPIERDFMLTVRLAIKELLSQVLHVFPESRLGPAEFTYRGIRVRIDPAQTPATPDHLLNRWTAMQHQYYPYVSGELL